MSTIPGPSINVEAAPPAPADSVTVTEPTTTPVSKPRATQVDHPTRAVLRTILAVVLGVATTVPDLVTNAHLGNTAIGAQAVVVAGVVTRLLAIPSVDVFLARWLPFLSAAPPA